MAYELFLPDITPATSSLALIDEMTATFPPLLAPGATQRNQRGGARWRATLEYPPLTGANRARMRAFIAACRGRLATIWYSPAEYTQRGSYPSTNLIPNSALSAVTGWTSANTGQVTASASSNRLRMKRAGTGTSVHVATSSTFAVTSGATYVFRASVVKGKGAVNMQLGAGSTTGGVAAIASAITETRRVNVLDTAASAARAVSFYDIFTGKAVDDFYEVEYPEYSRCFQVNGASQTGSQLAVSTGYNADGTLLTGDMIEVNGQLVRLTQDFDTPASGSATVSFEPALRTSPANNDPVTVYRPMGRFMLAQDVQEDSSPGGFTRFALTLDEVVA